jgi:hypothetical protein
VPAARIFGTLGYLKNKYKANKVIDEPVKPMQANNMAEAQLSQSGSDALLGRPLERRYNDTAAPKNSNAPSVARPLTSALPTKFKKASKKKIEKTAKPDARRTLVARMASPNKD